MFFDEADYARDLLAQAAGRAGAELWCYCLMTNHVRIATRFDRKIQTFMATIAIAATLIWWLL